MKLSYRGFLMLIGLLPLVATAQTVVSGITYSSGQTVVVADLATIQAGPAVNVLAGANVTYYAGTSVTLSAGFTASTGSNFRTVLTGGMTTYALTVQSGSGGMAGVPAGTTLGITAAAPPSGATFTNWFLISGTGTFTNASAASTSFTLGSANATVRAIYYNPDPNADDDGDGVSNGLEITLGLNRSDPTDVNVSIFTYDKINQLKTGPGGQYIKDAEGNIKQVRP